MLFANRELPGDFDIQVDFQIGEGRGQPKQEHLDGATLGVSIEGQMYHITRLRDTSQDIVFAWSNQGNLSVGQPDFRCCPGSSAWSGPAPTWTCSSIPAVAGRNWQT